MDSTSRASITILGDGPGPLESAMIQLVRLAVVAQTVAPAARELRRWVQDESVLRLARVNVSRALETSPSAVMARAAAILDGALSLAPTHDATDHVASCGWLHAGPFPHCGPPAPTA